MKNFILLSIIFTAFQINTLAISIATQDNGDWNSKSTWSPNQIPQDGDQVIINSNHTVEITSNTYNKKEVQLDIIINGTLQFNEAKLWLADGSMISINQGGTLAGNGNNNNEKLSIGNNWIWTEKDGNLTGPSSLTSGGVFVALPVTFVTTQIEDNQLIWTCSEVTNLSHYNIESSSDGINFDHFSTIEVNSSSIYSTNIEKGYYRVVGIDFDNTSTVSDIVFNSNGENTYFNARTTSTSFVIEGQEGLNIDIYSIDGFLIERTTMSSQVIEIDNTNIKGLVIIVAHTGNFKESIQLIVE